MSAVGIFGSRSVDDAVEWPEEAEEESDEGGEDERENKGGNCRIALELCLALGSVLRCLFRRRREKPNLPVKRKGPRSP